MSVTDENYDRSRSYKNRSKDCGELRRKRNESLVSLRKQKKDDNLFKKRNLREDLSDTSPLQERTNQQRPTPLLTLEEIKHIVVERKGNVPINDLFNAVQCARKMLSKELRPPLREFIEAGLVPYFVELLKFDDNNRIQFEAAWALTNVASGDSDQTRAVVEAGGVKQLIRLLSSDDLMVVEQAIWAIGNIAGDGPEMRDFAIAEGCVDPLLSLVIPAAKHAFMRNLTWSISNLCRNKRPPPSLDVAVKVLPVFRQLIHHPDKEVLADACWGLSYLSDGDNDRIQIVVEAGVVGRLVELLQCKDPTIMTASLRTLGNIVTGNDEQTQHVINFNVINIPIMMELFGKADFKTQKEITWVVTNIVSGGKPSHVAFLIDSGVLPPLCNMLSCQDTKTVVVVLEALNKILHIIKADDQSLWVHVCERIEECGGLDRIEALQTHEHTDVYKLSVELIEDHFMESEDQAVPSTSNEHLADFVPNGEIVL